MALSTQEAIVRFDQNEERLDTFINKTGTYSTNSGQPDVETLPSFMARNSQALNLLAATNVRGDWAVTTSYSVWDEVKYSGTWYRCVVAHTSTGSFDSSKWRLSQGLTLSALADQSTSENIGHVGNGSNVVARTVKAKLNDFSAIPDYNGTMQQKFDYASLYGATYVPKGSYALSSTPKGTFFAASKTDVVDSNKQAVIIYFDELMRKADSVPRAKNLLSSNRYLINNWNQGVVNLGDSISHGAYSGNAYSKHWTYALARALRAEYGCEAIGEFPMESLYNPEAQYVTKQLADVVFSAGWGTTSTNPAPYNYPVGRFGVACSDSVNGKTYYSETNGATIQLTVPTISKVISFKYTQFPSGGTFTVHVNGALKMSVNTSGALTNNLNTYNIPLEDNGKGECVVLITKTDSNPVEINALYNLKTDLISATEVGKLMQFHNYAQSGRQLSAMSETAIIRACNAACLIMSLGYNDWAEGAMDVEDAAGNALFAAFKQRIDWLIQYANVFKSLVVVQDFVWYAPKTSRTRQQLRRLAEHTNGIYIPYPDNFCSDGTTQTTTGAPLPNTRKLFADNAHPNALGNEMIFSTLASALGLPVTSINQGLKYYDWKFPLKITSTSIVNDVGNVSSVQQVGDRYVFSMNMKTASGTLAANTLETICSSLPEKFRGGETINLMPKREMIDILFSTGAVQTLATLETPATLSLYSNVTGKSAFKGDFEVGVIV